ncbi:MAG: hypothetical protein IJU14_01095 [Clostridia bacterium]|nr:hypothetical protein [Clostridia bacterium]
MTKMIPLAKQSKKARKEYYKKQRNMWTTNPVTKVKESKKIYKRNRFQAKSETENGFLFCVDTFTQNYI